MNLLFAVSVNPENGETVYSGNLAPDTALELLTRFVIAKKAEALARPESAPQGEKECQTEK